MPFDPKAFIKKYGDAPPEGAEPPPAAPPPAEAPKGFDPKAFAAGKLSPEVGHALEGLINRPFKTMVTAGQDLIGAGEKWVKQTSKLFDPEVSGKTVPTSTAAAAREFERLKKGELPSTKKNSELVSGAAGFATGVVTSIPKAVLGGLSMLADFNHDSEKALQTYIKNPAAAAADFTKQMVTDPVGTQKRISEATKDMDAFDTYMFLGGLVSPAKGPWNKMGKAAIGGIPTEAAERSALVLEDSGFKIEPRQLKPEGNVRTPGFGEANMRNNAQQAAAVLTKPTGLVTKEITPNWITQRLNDIGSQYNKIFSSDKFFKVDRDALEKLKGIEEFAGAAGTTGSPQTAEVIRKILGPYRKMTAANPEFVPPFFEVRGDLLQSLRTGLTEIKNGAEGTEAWQANNAFQAITGSIARNHEKHAAALSALDKQYASTMFLRHLDEAGGIKKGMPSLPTAARLYEKLGYRSVEPYAIAKAASDVGMIAPWEIQPATDLVGLIKHYSGKGAAAATLGASNLPRTQFARGIQRFIMQVKADPKMAGRMTPEAESLLNDIANLPIDESGVYMPQGQQLPGPKP